MPRHQRSPTAANCEAPRANFDSTNVARPRLVGDTPAPRPLVQMTEADLRAILAEHMDHVAEVVAARPAKTLLDTSGVSQLVGVTGQTVEKLRDEDMPHVQVDESYRYDAASVLEWLRQRAEGRR